MTEPKRWDVSQTRELVHQRFGAGQLAMIRPVLRAVNVRLHHAAMHYAGLKAVTARNLDEPIRQGATTCDLMDAEGDEPGATNLFFITCEMHLYGAIQALHAVADNLAHVLYYGLGWNVEGKPSKVSLNSVWDRMRQLSQGQHPMLKPVFQCVNELKLAPPFKVLEDATNHIKHHGGLHATVSWDPCPDCPYELRLSAFQRQDMNYPQQEVVTFLKQTHMVMSQAVVHTGCALNEWLKSSAHDNSVQTPHMHSSPTEPANAN
jgi:hypothetical protein